jgi:hypothetical protein
MPPPQAPSLCEDKGLAHHQFSAGMVSLFMDLVLLGPVSQRAAAAVLRLLACCLKWGKMRLPCANSGRLWMVRVGLYALTCEKEKADDWLWMMDHTVQLGPWKCLVIVGIRVSAWRSLDRPLRHEDLSLLNLTPMKTADKRAVAEELKRTDEKMGTPVAVLSDEGAELKSGMELYRDDLKPGSPQPPHLHDIKHKAAAYLKKELDQSDRWAEFVKCLSHTKVAVILTDLAFLNPPRLRNKARFMNLECVVKWGSRVLQFLKKPTHFPGNPIDLDQLERKLGWLRRFEKELRVWAELLEVIDAAEKYVRRHGYHRQADRKLRRVLRPLAKRSASRRLMKQLLDFIKEQSDKLKQGEPMPGHTEVLESLLGKYKATQARHSQGGMTASLLNIGAIVLPRSPEIIQQALAAIPVKTVNDWMRNNLGQTVASRRKLALQ